MRLRSLTITAVAGLALGGLITVAPANAAPATLYAYPAGTDSPVGCPDSATPADQCSLGAALARAEPGDTVELADGAHPYVGNWTVGTAGTPTTAAAVTIEGAPDISLVPVLDGNDGSSIGCTTASCSSSILTIAGGTSVVVQRLRFTDADSATGNSGGAIDIGNGTAGGNLTVRDSTFDHNAAANGGGAINAAYDGSASVAVSDSTFDHNSAYDGGAVSVGPVSSSSTLAVSTSSFDNNVADADDGMGGAISLYAPFSGTSASAVVADSTFQQNSAQEGGAIAPFGAITLVVAESTFDANTATSEGGAVYVEPLGRISSSSLLRSTFGNDRVRPPLGAASDELGSDGGLVVAGDLFTGACVLPTGTSIDDGHNAAVDSSCLNKGTGDVVSAAVGSGLAAPAANRKSATRTIALTAGNPAIGAVPSGATALHVPVAYRALCPRTDQTGYRTPTGSACDAGAVDLAAPLKPTIAVSGSHTVAHGSKHTITGRTRPGSTVTLYGGSTKLATTTATSVGAFAFARTLTATSRFTADADHQNSTALILTVVTLTLTPASKPLKKGTHTLTGHAPAGRSVTLLRDGHTVARTTATGKNGYAFKVRLGATHRFRVSCDGITTRPTTVRITK